MGFHMFKRKRRGVKSSKTARKSKASKSASRAAPKLAPASHQVAFRPIDPNPHLSNPTVSVPAGHSLNLFSPDDNYRLLENSLLFGTKTGFTLTRVFDADTKQKVSRTFRFQLTPKLFFELRSAEVSSLFPTLPKVSPGRNGNVPIVT